MTVKLNEGTLIIALLQNKMAVIISSIIIINHLVYKFFKNKNSNCNKTDSQNNHGKNSERSEECIDFTMIITSRNNGPISNYGGFRCKSEYPWCIIEVKS
ncbi:Uncharacterized protein FWK35_00025022 [Aphis craccivora]|uniref:Uncharacterized protein n=1 Tax=Aphis craccivora TaxID=307492 RepID=A0A6G0YHG6_APHCR|nr:Uncharacterized protein FWK35_00025022 [Aphis craccivora]